MNLSAIASCTLMIESNQTKRDLAKHDQIFIKSSTRTLNRKNSHALTRSTIAMRTCGVCRFGGWRLQLQQGAPSAACVVATSCTRLEGRQGALAQIEAAAVNAHVGSASACCTRCRCITWLSREGVDINIACVEFWQNWHKSKNIADSLLLVKQCNGNKKQRLCRRSDCKSKKGSDTPGSVVKKQ